MEVNVSDLEANVTFEQIASALNLNVSNSTNDSETQKVFDLYDDYRARERELLVVYGLVAYVLGTLIILSNLTVVISSGLILKKGQQPKSTYLLLGNVSLADTIIGFSLIFSTMIKNTDNSHPMCIFQIGMIVCPTMVSIFSVGFIAIDRYIYILHGLYYQRWINATRVRIGIVIIWLVGILIACLPATGWTGMAFENYRCVYITVFPSSLLIVISSIVLAVIMIVCLLYVLILRRAVKTVNEIRAFHETNQISYINKAFDKNNDLDESSETTVTITVSTNSINEQQHSSIELKKIENVNINSSDFSHTESKFLKISQVTKETCTNAIPSKLKAVRTVLIVTACFVGTWAPYYVSVLIYVRCNVAESGYACIPIETLTLGPLFYLGMTNSLCDPLIYAWRHSGFKQTLKAMVRKYCWKMRVLILSFKPKSEI